MANSEVQIGLSDGAQLERWIDELNHRNGDHPARIIARADGQDAEVYTVGD